MTLQKTTLVIGATEKTERYANMAVRRLQNHNHPVLAFGLRKGQIAGTEIETDFTKLVGQDIDTVTMYINPLRQVELYDSIINLKPKRVIFNPGTENEEFERRLEEKNIITEEACTLVLLNTNQY